MTSEASSAPSMTPQHVTATCVLILTLLVGVGVVTYLGSVVRPVLIAVFLYFIIQPAATWLTRRGLPSWLAYLSLSLLLLAAIAGLVRVAYHSVQAFQAELPRYRELLSERLASVPGFHPEQFDGRSLLELLQLETGDIVTYAFGTAMHVSEVVLMVFFYLVFVILDAHRLPARIHRGFPESSEHIMRAIEGINTGITGYMGVKTLVKDKAHEAVRQEIERDQGDAALARRDEPTPLPAAPKPSSPAPKIKGRLKNYSAVIESSSNPSLPKNGNGSSNGHGNGHSDLATNRQAKYILSSARQLNLSLTQIADEIKKIVGRECGVHELTKKEAGQILEFWTTQVPA